MWYVPVVAMAAAMTVAGTLAPRIAEAQGITDSDLVKHVVMIHAETRPRGINRYFPAIVIESRESGSLLVSASWGAEPFPIPPNGKPIGAIHILDTNHPVKVVAYDESLGVGVFSTDVALQPWPIDLMAMRIAVGDELDELILANRHYDEPPYAAHRVVATNQRLPYRTADGKNVNVEGTVIIEGKLAGRPGSLLLKDGKLAAIFLNNEVRPALNHHAIPTSALLSRYLRLISATDQ